ncbi:uncharacterized protein LOC120116044 [Hibiscus syriacus]|uniref:uncharacterized protein LOC120116044 n=1 Tax=Hibiscus syriacus TaxID=106335 RepID=UPI0019233C4E|nr:uncharacterized protein LOC120116044 [Hibiscus syriacus]
MSGEYPSRYYGLCLFLVNASFVACWSNWADHDQVNLLGAILDQFSRFFGHMVNSNKTRVFFTGNKNDELINQLCIPLGFQVSKDLGKYLGMPLFHNRVTKNTFQFIIDKVRQKLCNWTDTKLSLAGRITLAKSTLLSIPNYFIQTAAIPKGVCDQIEQIVRDKFGHDKPIWRWEQDGQYTVKSAATILTKILGNQATAAGTSLRITMGLNG